MPSRQASCFGILCACKDDDEEEMVNEAVNNTRESIGRPISYNQPTPQPNPSITLSPKARFEREKASARGRNIGASGSNRRPQTMIATARDNHVYTNQRDLQPNSSEPDLHEVSPSPFDHSDHVWQVSTIDELDKRLQTDPDRDRLEELAIKCADYGVLPSSYTLNPIPTNLGVSPVAGGAFGDVWKGEYNGQAVAIKVITTYSGSGLRRMKQKFFREVVIWKHLSHPNIVPLLGVAPELFPLCMVSQWMPQGNIRTYAQDKPVATKLQLLKDILSGLEYLHCQPIVHGDLKGDNILVDESGKACLSDFGHASVALSTVTPTSGGLAPGSTRWLAPELLRVEGRALLTEATDIFALSLVILEVFTGKIPYEGLREETVMLRTSDGKRPPRPSNSTELGLSDDIWGIVVRGWDQIPSLRPQVLDFSVLVSREIAERESRARYSVGG